MTKARDLSDLGGGGGAAEVGSADVPSHGGDGGGSGIVILRYPTPS